MWGIITGLCLSAVTIWSGDWVRQWAVGGGERWVTQNVWATGCNLRWHGKTRNTRGLGERDGRVNQHIEDEVIAIGMKSQYYSQLSLWYHHGHNSSLQAKSTPHTPAALTQDRYARYEQAGKRGSDIYPLYGHPEGHQICMTGLVWRIWVVSRASKLWNAVSKYVSGSRDR